MSAPKIQIHRITASRLQIAPDKKGMYFTPGKTEVPIQLHEAIVAEVELDNKIKIASLQYQINSAINVCEGRLENGASPQDAIQWLQEETDQIFTGEVIYEED